MKLSEKLIELKKLNEDASIIKANIDSKRDEILKELEENKLKQYKDEVATISYVVKKNIVFTRDKEEILKEVEDNKLVKYIDVVPETRILNKKFSDDIKNDEFSLDGIDVEEKELPMIRFSK